MEDTRVSRLRRLDSLFAERVLGLSLESKCKGWINDGDSPYCDTCGWYGTWGDKLDHKYTPKEFTRSLDAAWASVGDNSVHLETAGRGRPKWLCYWNPDWQCGGAEFTTYGDHPAEALVIAALRAVGTPEEELV